MSSLTRTTTRQSPSKMITMTQLVSRISRLSDLQKAPRGPSVGRRFGLPWVSLGDEPFSPEGWDGDQAVKAGGNAPQAPLDQGGEGSGRAPGSAMAGVFRRGWSGGRHPTCRLTPPRTAPAP